MHPHWHQRLETQPAIAARVVVVIGGLDEVQVQERGRHFLQVVVAIRVGQRAGTQSDCGERIAGSAPRLNLPRHTDARHLGCGGPFPGFVRP